MERIAQFKTVAEIGSPHKIDTRQGESAPIAYRRRVRKWRKNIIHPSHAELSPLPILPHPSISKFSEPPTPRVSRQGKIRPTPPDPIARRREILLRLSPKEFPFIADLKNNRRRGIEIADSLVPDCRRDGTEATTLRSELAGAFDARVGALKQRMLEIGAAIRRSRRRSSQLDDRSRRDNPPTPLAAPTRKRAELD
jgi:hypothetical protein